MKITYISQYFPPEVCAPANRVHEFAREWVSCGNQVQVITGFPNHPEGVVHPEYKARWRRLFARDDRDGIRVHRTWLYPAANRGFWGRSMNYGSFAVSASMAGPWLASKSSVLIATSPQLLVGLAGYITARSCALPFIFEVRDLWPESIEGVGAAGKGAALVRLLDRCANFLYRVSDHIVVVGARQRAALVNKGVDPAKVSIVMNGVAQDFHCPPERGDELKLELGLKNVSLFTYCGTIGMAHGLSTLLDAADRLRHRADIAFLIIGDGAERSTVLDHIRTRRLGNVHCLGKQARERIPAYLAASRACVVPLRRSRVFETAIPSKIFESMAAARPVILAVEGEARDIVTSANAGVAVRPEDAEALADAVVLLHENVALAERLGLNGVRAVREKYSRERQAADYLSLLARIVAGERYNRPIASGFAAPNA